MRNIEFNSKEEYLAYRSEWKGEYKKISQFIRDLKAEIRDAQRNRKYAGDMQNSLRAWREHATLMLSELKASKEEAQRQYMRARLDFEDAQKEQYIES